MKRPIARLRAWCLGVYGALLIASIALIWQGIGNLRYQSFHSAHTVAETLAQQMNDALAASLTAEELRAATDYEFFVASGEQYVQRSPLAEVGRASELPGLVGHFQIDQEGRLSTPLLPRREQLRQAALSSDEVRERQAKEAELKDLLKSVASDSDRNLRAIEEVVVTAAAEAAGRSKLDDLAFNSPFEEAVVASAPQTARPKLKQENRQLQDYAVALEAEAEADRSDDLLPAITSIVSEVDPLSLAMLDDHHLFAHRRVYTGGEMKVQGFVLETAPFVERFFTTPFTRSPLARNADLVVALEGELLQVLRGQSGRGLYSADPLDGTLLLRTRLAAPANGVELAFNARELPLGAGATTLFWTAAIALGVLTFGLWFVYRLGREQIALAEQQRDFVAAVSHELRTPLTSIRMYGEMLRAGWADEDKKRTYYDFIFNESERLSRLIANVLQLSRLDRNSTEVNLVEKNASELLPRLSESVRSLSEASGFTVVVDPAPDVMLSVDEDAWTQIMLNLIDNAIKFSRDTDEQRVVVRTFVSGGEIACSVRDFGPGIDRSQMKRIFTMFYRAESELTRETVGTGIGLALVQRLAKQMSGRVDVVNRDPGAEFTLYLPTDT